MIRDQDRDIRAPHRTQARLEVNNAERIDTRKRLVEQQPSGFRHPTPGEFEPATLPARQSVGDKARAVGEIKGLQVLVGATASLRRRESRLQREDGLKIVAHRQRAKHRSPLRQIAQTQSGTPMQRQASDVFPV